MILGGEKLSFFEILGCHFVCSHVGMSTQKRMQSRCTYDKIL